MVSLWGVVESKASACAEVEIKRGPYLAWIGADSGKAQEYSGIQGNYSVCAGQPQPEKVGMSMLPTKLLIFGSPNAGTPLMIAAPSTAIDLPLKILIWKDGKGKVWVSYNRSAYIKERHGLPQELLQNIAIIETLASKAGE